MLKTSNLWHGDMYEVTYNTDMDIKEEKAHETHSSVEQKYLDLIEIGQNEVVICAIKKHPVGLLGIYLSGLAVAGVILGAISLVGAFIDSQIETPAPIATIATVVALIIATVSLFFTYIAGFVYQNNILILTNEKVAQILYRNLIDRKISQVSLGELQDITVDQKGLLARLFQYGTLVLETAGEQNNYNFTFTRYPHHCAKELVEAHDMSIKRYGN